ncbi:TPA: ABC transporter ATP-binding protein [Listeria monocytogenes]
MAYIEIDTLTKDYGNKNGIFDISLSVEQGEIFGFAGINGAGKTTTIRHLMGFLNPDSGTSTIQGLDCWAQSAKVKQKISYIPGEIAFPDDGTGETFLKRQIELNNRGSMEYCKELCDKFQLDATANLKSMSKGMKQKTAIILAFMLDSDIIIMDEPTTGLDPLMRDVFLELVLEEKKKGKTIFMSTHIFEEIEAVCDRVALIKDGKIKSIKNIDEIRYNKNKTYRIEFKNSDSYINFLNLNYKLDYSEEQKNQVQVQIHDSNIKSLMNDLKNLDVLFFKEIKSTLEDYFKEVFKEEMVND